MSRLIFFAVAISMLLTSCMREELPVPARIPGEAKVMTVCMGNAYQDQVWLDLANGEVVSTNLKTAWDLAFENSPEGWRIMLNGSRLMTAWNLGAVAITLPTDTAGMGAQRRIDAPSGDADSTAFGDWRGTGNVYVLDLGYNAFGGHLGLRKLKLIEVGPDSFQFEWAQLNGTGLVSVTLPKDASRTFTYFSFANGVVSIEPARGTWDLLFTQYTHQFYVPFLPYMVSGVLVDGTSTRVARIPEATFENITLSDTLQYPFSTRRDIIGFDWKEYSFETSSYTVDPYLCYIVHTRNGTFHKFHFIDFYNDQGQAGCPSFEVVPL